MVRHEEDRLGVRRRGWRRNRFASFQRRVGGPWPWNLGTSLARGPASEPRYFASSIRPSTHHRHATKSASSSTRSASALYARGFQQLPAPQHTISDPEAPPRHTALAPVRHGPPALAARARARARSGSRGQRARRVPRSVETRSGGKAWVKMARRVVCTAPPWERPR